MPSVSSVSTLSMTRCLLCSGCGTVFSSYLVSSGYSPDFVRYKIAQTMHYIILVIILMLLFPGVFLYNSLFPDEDSDAQVPE